MMYLISTILLCVFFIIGAYIARHQINDFIDNYSSNNDFEIQANLINKQIIACRENINNLENKLNQLNINFDSIYKKRYQEALRMTQLMVQKASLSKIFHFIKQESLNLFK